MDVDKARTEFQAGRLQEAVIEPADDGNGWIVLVKGKGGKPERITDSHGAEKIYHSLDHATEVAKGIGFQTARVEERF